MAWYLLWFFNEFIGKLDKVLDDEKLIHGLKITMNWLFLELIIVFIIYLFFKFSRKWAFFTFFEMFFEKVYLFFEDLLWKEEKVKLKTTVTLLFFIILFSNLLWTLLDFANPAIWKFSETNPLVVSHQAEAWHSILEHYVRIPTVDINFNIAMAIFCVLLLMFEQAKFLWFWHFVYEYFPIFWKKYIPYELGKLPKIIDYLLFVFVKIFDIIISVFLWLLEIVWMWSKIISLSFRLFWNMYSWWLLLWMLMVWLAWMTTSIFWDWVNFPILFPLLIYIQWTLVSFIQALVFPLLVTIFIKVAKAH